MLGVHSFTNAAGCCGGACSTGLLTRQVSAARRRAAWVHAGRLAEAASHPVAWARKRAGAGVLLCLLGSANCLEEGGLSSRLPQLLPFSKCLCWLAAARLHWLHLHGLLWLAAVQLLNRNYLIRQHAQRLAHGLLRLLPVCRLPKLAAVAPHELALCSSLGRLAGVSELRPRGCKRGRGAPRVVGGRLELAALGLTDCRRQRARRREDLSLGGGHATV